MASHLQTVAVGERERKIANLKKKIFSFSFLFAVEMSTCKFLNNFLFAKQRKRFEIQSYEQIFLLSTNFVLTFCIRFSSIRANLRESISSRQLASIKPQEVTTKKEFEVLFFFFKNVHTKFEPRFKKLYN